MTCPATHSIVVLEKPAISVADNVISCAIGEELKFDRGALERCSCTTLEDVDIDLLVVLASIAFADRRVSRRRGTHSGRSHAKEWRDLVGLLPARSWLRNVVRSEKESWESWTNQS